MTLLSEERQNNAQKHRQIAYEWHVDLLTLVALVKRRPCPGVCPALWRTHCGEQKVEADSLGANPHFTCVASAHVCAFISLSPGFHKCSISTVQRREEKTIYLRYTPFSLGHMLNKWVSEPWNSRTHLSNIPRVGVWQPLPISRWVNLGGDGWETEPIQYKSHKQRAAPCVYGPV